MARTKSDKKSNIFARNKRAFHDYTVIDTLEAGMALSGAEIKSIRAGRITLTESFVRIKDGQAWLVNAYIAPWGGGFDRDFEVRASRRLLLHKRQLKAWEAKVEARNLTIVPLKVYTSRNLAKIEIALVEGKKLYDKREVLKKKAVQLDIDRALRGKEV